MVIHTKNRGVSSARNTGMDCATGEFISFVDGDDYLSPDFLDYMLDVAMQTKAHFVMSRNCYKSPYERQVTVDEVEIYSSEKAASELLYPYIEIGCWNKIFLRDFLVTNNIRFPVNFHMGEGLNFIVNAALLSSIVGVGRRKVYYYRKDNLTSATTLISVEKFINALAALDNIKEYSTNRSEELETALTFHRYLTTFYALNAIIRTGTMKKYPLEHKQWTQSVKRGAISMMGARVAPSLKLKILIYSLCPNFWLSARSRLALIKRKLLALISH